MAGPFPQYSEPYPDQPTFQAEPPPAAPGYPGMLPPPLEYPKRRRWRPVVIIVAVLVVVAGIVTAIVLSVGNDEATTQLTSATAKTSIQGYLDALSRAEVDNITRNTLCGMYDAVHDKRSDQALAKLNSEAFRKQFSRAQVTSIDKIVYWSPNQAQVLFTMRVTPTAKGGQPRDEQGIAQVLVQDNRVLVCSYLLRSGSRY
jgi:hypothetical protein